MQKLCHHFFNASSQAVAAAPLPFSLPPQHHHFHIGFVASSGLYTFFPSFILLDIHERSRKGTDVTPSLLSHPCCSPPLPPSPPSPSFPSVGGAALDLRAFLWLIVVRLCLRAPLSPLGCAEGAGSLRRGTVYGSCGLQDRARQLHVASRTGSHAFPRDLRGSHPGDHGGNGEALQIGVAPGEGHAAQRERFGESSYHMLCLFLF